jgi:hypothetical protein
VKANVDGAVLKSDGKISGAVVIRDKEGQYLGSSALSLAYDLSKLAKLSVAEMQYRFTLISTNNRDCSK